MEGTRHLISLPVSQQCVERKITTK
uniref:Uncharacterized protein n=1 Tax=Anopheles christyi TaxID=43041 RepID=A0A182KIZ7_9DIPT